METDRSGSNGAIEGPDRPPKPTGSIFRNAALTSEPTAPPVPVAPPGDPWSAVTSEPTAPPMPAAPPVDPWTTLTSPVAPPLRPTPPIPNGPRQDAWSNPPTPAVFGPYTADLKAEAPSAREPASPPGPTPPKEAAAGLRRAAPFTSAAALILVLVMSLLLLSTRADLHAAQRAATLTSERVDTLEQRSIVAGNQSAANDQTVASLKTRVAALEKKKVVLSTPELAEAAERSVFTVITSDALGTGWVIASKGGSSTLVTNHHVVDPLGVGGAVKIRQDDLIYDATVTVIDAKHDLALLKTDHQFPVLPTNTGAPAIGSPVVIIGSPLGLGGSVSTGVVSAMRAIAGVKYIQFSAPISPGNSGGPVLNDKGEVIGIASAKYVDPSAEGLGFAIPVNILCTAVTTCAP